MPLQYQRMQINDFSGGLTDVTVGSSAGTFSAINCFYVNSTKKLVTSYGFRCIVDDTAGSTLKIKHIAEVDDSYIAFTSNRLYALDIEDESKVQFKNFAEIKNDEKEVYSNEWRSQIIYGYTPYRRESLYESPYRIYEAESGGSTQFVSYKAGLPEFTGATIPDSTQESGYKLYRYKVIYATEYTTSKGVTFREVGYSQYLTFYSNGLITEAAQPSITISGITEMVNTDYDVANTRVEIYRTIGDGTSYYRLEDYDGDDPSYPDVTNDTDLVNGLAFYAGDNEEYSHPPKCAAMKIIGNTGYYGDVFDGDDHKPYRLIQSIVGIPTAVNYSFFDDMENRIVGIGAVGSTPIIFTTKEIYRLEGIIAADGTGSFRRRTISTTVGCASHKSIAETGGLIYFAGNDGFYVTDGYTVSNITVTPKYDLLETYRLIVQDDTSVDINSGQPTTDEDHYRKRITSVLDTANNRVRWFCTKSSGVNNDIIFTYDISNQCFTTESCNKATYTAGIEYERGFLRGDSDGNLYRHDTEYSDGVLPVNGQPKESWAFTPLPLELKTTANHFGASNLKKWINYMSFTIENRGKMSFAIKSFNDGSGYGTSMVGVEVTDSVSWGDPSVLWRQADVKWRPSPVKNMKRRFPKGHMRCRNKQVNLTPSEVNVYSSTEYGSVKVTALAADRIDYFKAQLLKYDEESDTNDPFVWPDDILGYKILLSGDNYQTEHVITAVDIPARTITFAGGTSVITAPSIEEQDFIIRGELKRQQFTIDSMVYNFAFMDDIGAEDVGK